MSADQGDQSLAVATMPHRWHAQRAVLEVARLALLKNPPPRCAEVCDTLTLATDSCNEARLVLRHRTPEGGITLDESDEDDCEKEQIRELCHTETTAKGHMISCWLYSRAAGELIAECSHLLLGSPCLAVGAVFSLVSSGGAALLHLLTSTPHDGACEVAAVALERICGALWQCQDEAMHVLPFQWLEQCTLAVTGRGPLWSEYLTFLRRGAGLPLAIRAILRAAHAQGVGHRCGSAYMPPGMGTVEMVEKATDEVTGEAARERVPSSPDKQCAFTQLGAAQGGRGQRIISERCISERCLWELIRIGSHCIGEGIGEGGEGGGEARGEEAQYLWRVRSMFSLRLAVLDKRLALDGADWTVACLTLAFDALRAPRWPVRSLHRYTPACMHVPLASCSSVSCTLSTPLHSCMHACNLGFVRVCPCLYRHRCAMQLPFSLPP